MVRELKQISRILFQTLVLVAFGVAGTGTLSHAGASSDWAVTDMSKTRLVAASTGVGKAHEVILGLHIKLSQGWKTYWRNPGDSGLPPQFDWSGSANIEKAEILWPKPKAFDSYGLLTWGYQDEVVFPIRITLKKPEETLAAKLQVFYGICEEVCVPVKQNFEVRLPAGAAEMSENASIIQRYEARVPVSMGQATTIEQLNFSELAENTLEVEAKSREPFVKPFLILEGTDGDFFEVKQVQLSNDKKTAKFTVRSDLAGKNKMLKGRALTATILDEVIAFEAHAVVK